MALPEPYLALRRALLVRLSIGMVLIAALVIAVFAMVPASVGEKPSPALGSGLTSGQQATPPATPVPAPIVVLPSPGRPGGSLADALRSVSELESLEGKSLEVVTRRSAEDSTTAAESAGGTDAEGQKAAAALTKLPKGPHLQAGTFASVKNAEEMRKKLETEGYPAYVESRVHVGPFPSRKEADRAREKLKEQGLTTVFIAQ